MSDRWSDCKNATYVSLETFRADGSGVRTPVWVAPDEEAPGDRVIVWTVTGSWKVARVRRNPAVRLAPCSARGRIIGEWVDAQAVVMTPDQSNIAVRWLHRKYGVRSRVAVLLSRTRRGREGTICIAIARADGG